MHTSGHEIDRERDLIKPLSNETGHEQSFSSRIVIFSHTFAHIIEPLQSFQMFLTVKLHHEVIYVNPLRLFIIFSELLNLHFLLKHAASMNQVPFLSHSRNYNIEFCSILI